MRRTMVGVAPAANTPQAFDAAKTLATNRDAASGHENADTAVALPPDMVKALGEMTMLSAAEPEGPTSAPMTKRMSEAPLLRAPPALPSGAPSVPLPRSSPSVAPSAPRSSPSAAPPRFAATVSSSPSSPPGASSPAGTSPGLGKEGAITLAPATDPMAAPLGVVPLERKPLVTTYALSPIAVAGLVAQPGQPIGPPEPAVAAAEPAPAARVAPEARPAQEAARLASEPRMASQASSAPPLHSSMAPAPSPVIASPSPPPHSPMPMLASMPVRSDETMVLAPAAAPLAPTVSMPPMPPAMPAGMSQVSQSSRAAIPAAPPRTGMQHAQQAQAAQAQQRKASMPPPPFVAAPMAWSPHGPPPLPSHPSLAETRSPSDEQPAALTYQVYNPASSPTGRSPALSRVSFPEPSTSKASLGLRVCLVLLGVCVVVGTAGAIILSSTDDPPKAATPPEPSAAVSAAPTPPPPAPPPPVAPPVVIGDPTPPPAAPVGTSGAKPSASGKPKPAGSAALKGAKIPPNPFGGGRTLPPKRK